MRFHYIAVLLFLIVSLTTNGQDVDEVDDVEVTVKPVVERKKQKSAFDKKEVPSKKKTSFLDDEVNPQSDDSWLYSDYRYDGSDFDQTTPRSRQRSSQNNWNWNSEDWSQNAKDDDEPTKGFSSFAFDNQPGSNTRATCTSLIDTKFPIFADTCGAVPQARYSLPNFFGHRERWQVAQFLQGMTSATEDQACLRSLKLLICPMVFPACSNSRAQSSPVLPCQSFCRAVKTQCAVAALDVFPCENLPQNSDICPNTQAFASLLSPTSFPSRSQQVSWNVAPQLNTNQWSLYSMLPQATLPLNPLQLNQQKSDDALWWSSQAEQLLNPSLNTLQYPSQKLDDLTRWQQKEQTQRSALSQLQYPQQKIDDLTARQSSTDQTQRSALTQLLQAKPEEIARWQQHLNPIHRQAAIDPRQVALLQGQTVGQLQNPTISRHQWNSLRQH